MIQIISFQNIHQNEIDTMMNDIALEFEEEIVLKSSNNTHVTPDKYWVALYQTEIIGTVKILKMDNDYAILKSMFVKKEYRGKEFNVAQLLLNKVYDWCKKEKINQIYLGTMSQFKAAHKFYEKNKFAKVLTSNLPSNFITNPIDTIFYKKEL